MKKLALLLITLTTLLSSCSSNEDIKIDLTNEDLIGTWNLTRLESDVKITVSYQGTTITGSNKAYGKEFDYTFTFASDPNEYYSNGEFTMVSTTDMAGETETIEYPITEMIDFSSGDWTIESNKLILNKFEEPIELIIQSFDNNKLVLKQYFDQKDTQSGQDVTLKGEGIMILEK